MKGCGAQEKADPGRGDRGARHGDAGPGVSGDDLTDPAKVAAYQRGAGRRSTLSLQRLQEAIPSSRARATYTTLMSQLEGTENRITIARRDYNDAVQAYNTRIRTFPDAIGAKIFYGAKPMVPFQATTPGAETAPTVDFGNAS